MDPEILVDFRRRTKWSQRLCARYLGVDLATWKNWEAGKGGASLENARKLRAMVALAGTEDGAKALSEWAADDDSRRAARREGRTLHPNSRLGR